MNGNGENGRALVPVQPSQTAQTAHPQRMIVIRLGGADGMPLVINAQLLAGFLDRLVGKMMPADAVLDPVTDAIRAAMKVPVRMMLRAMKGQLTRGGYPPEMLPRKVRRGEDTLVYATQYFIGLMLHEAVRNEWIADYADNPDSGAIEVNSFRPAADTDTLDAASIARAAARVAGMVAGAGAGARGAGSARADDPPAPTDDGCPSGTDAPPVDGPGLARASRQPV